jgi:hypothetical protein
MRPPGRPKGEYRSAQHEGTPVSEAVSRLARSRLAFLGHIGPASHPPTRGEPAGWFARLRVAARTRWREHPASVVLELARPVLSKYVRGSPWWFLAGAAASGAVVAKVRPWRLLSLSGLVAVAKSFQLPSLMFSALSTVCVPADMESYERPQPHW